MARLERNRKYDLLRFIGISCILLAHMNPPAILFQLRNFDVPLMVLLSGISFSQFSSEHYSSYSKYLRSRFTRLILPTWIFLIFYNFCILISGNDYLSLRDILLQITLIGGVDIGIWIIRIFFTMAIIAPFLNHINSTIENKKTFYYFTFAIYITYEMCRLIAFYKLHGIIAELVNILIFFTVPYGLIFLYGLRITSFDKEALRKHLIFFSIILTICLIIGTVVCGHIIPTQPFKYPPTLYYLSFSLAVSLSVYYTVIFHELRIEQSSIVQFIGKSTLWIYLWHWFYLKLYRFSGTENNFLIKFITIYSLSILTVYVQTIIIHWLNRKLPITKNQSYLLQKIFTG